MEVVKNYEMADIGNRIMIFGFFVFCHVLSLILEFINLNNTLQSKNLSLTHSHIFLIINFKYDSLKITK
jgi:hypothetical protein